MANNRNSPRRTGFKASEMPRRPEQRARRRPGPLVRLGLAGLGLAGLGLASCGDAEVGTDAPVVRDVALRLVDAPRPPDEVRPLTRDGGAIDVRAAGTTAEGELCVADRSTLYACDPQGLREITFFSERPRDEAPAQSIVAVVPRNEGGAWVVASNGLYRTEGLHYVAVDPSLTGGRAGFAAWTPPPLEGLWVAAEGQLLRRSPRAASAYTWDAPGDVRALEVAPDGGSALVVSSDGAWSLESREDDGFERFEVEAPVEERAATAHIDGFWWLAGASLTSTNDLTGAAAEWTRRAVPAPVDAVGRGPDGAVWWTDASGLYALHEDEARRLDPSAIEHAVFAPSGDVWVLTATAARGWRAGDRPSFANDIAPWLEAEDCIGCHLAPALDFRRYADFRSVAADALRRVEEGDMPRCGNNLCPPDQQIPPERYEVLDRWIATGMAP